MELYPVILIALTVLLAGMCVLMLRLRKKLNEKSIMLGQLYFILNPTTAIDKTTFLIMLWLPDFLKMSIKQPMEEVLAFKIFRNLNHKAAEFEQVMSQVKIINHIICHHPEISARVICLIKGLFNERHVLRSFCNEMTEATKEKTLGQRMQIVATFLPEPGKVTFVEAIISNDDYVAYILSIIPWNHNRKSFLADWRNMSTEEQAATKKVISYQKSILHQLPFEQGRRDVAEMDKYLNQQDS